MRHPLKLISRIDVSAFASVLIVLLALFMFPIRLFVDLPEPGVMAELPKVEHPTLAPHARREDAILIAIMRDGSIFYGNEMVSAYSIAERIRASIKNGSERTIYMRVDARSKYKITKAILEEVQLSGVEHVVFLAEQRRTGQNSY